MTKWAQIKVHTCHIFSVESEVLSSYNDLGSRWPFSRRYTSHYWRRSHLCSYTYFHWMKELLVWLPPFSLRRHVYHKGLGLYGQKRLIGTSDEWRQNGNLDFRFCWIPGSLLRKIYHTGKNERNNEWKQQDLNVCVWPAGVTIPDQEEE